MNTNKIIKNVLWGVSALVGFIVAEGVYKAGLNSIDKHEEIMADELDEGIELEE